MQVIWNYIKSNPKKLTLLGLLVATVAYAASFDRHNVTEVIIGRGLPEDAKISIDEGSANKPFMGWDDTNSQFIFSNDGTTSLPLGSGSGGGGGVNILENPEVEQGVGIGYVNAGSGTITENTSTQLFGTKSLDYDATNSASDRVVTVAQPVPVGLEGRSCSAKVAYKWDGGNVGELEFVAELDDGTDLHTPVQIEPTLGSVREVFVAFICPSADSIQLAIQVPSVPAGDPAVITLDSFHLGSNIKEGVVDGKITAWKQDTRGGAGWIGEPTIFSEKIYYRRVGESMQIQASVVWDGVGAAVDLQYTIPDGLTISEQVNAVATAQASGVLGAGGFYDISGTSNVNLTSALQVRRYSTTTIAFETQNLNTIVGNELQSGDAINFDITVPIAEWQGTGTTETVTLETQGAFFKGGITGANYSMSLTDSDFIDLSDPTWTLSSDGGNLTCYISCNAATPSGSTCSSGNETVGLSCVLPYAGRWQFCAQGSYEVQTNQATERLNNSFRLSHTALADTSTNITAGNNRFRNGLEDITGGGEKLTHGFHICETFQLPAGQQTIALQVATDTNVSPLANLLMMDNIGGAGGGGDRKVTWSVDAITQQFPQAVAIANVETGATADCSTGNICSGSYAPIVTNVENFSAITSSTASYTRVGNLVTVYGRFVATTASDNRHRARISLPIASTFSAVNDAYGVFNIRIGGSGANRNGTGDGEADTVNNELVINGSPTAALTSVEMKYTCQYIIK